MFPWRISVPRPTARGLSDGFSRARDALRILRENAKDVVGFGYRVDFQRVSHRRLGGQLLPEQIVIDSLNDFLRLIGMTSEFQRFVDLSATILSARPEFKPLLCRRPSLVLDHSNDWSRLLAACRYFQDHPRPNLYSRQLEIPGVDTKFIESRRAILAELLDIILPPGAKTQEIAGLSDHGFERRFGLRVEEPQIRFRVLDAACSLSGLTDISAPLSEFRDLALPVRRVFLIENKMNGLCFPNCPEALTIFGLGYGAGCLAGIPWLEKTAIYYWGDIDTHGFAILDQLRGQFPKMSSFLMDEQTLLRFRELWGREDPAQRFTKDLTRLNSEEVAIFNSLRENRWGDSIRLEQERIAFGKVREAVAKISDFLICPGHYRAPPQPHGPAGGGLGGKG